MTRSGSRWATTTRPSCPSGSTCTRSGAPSYVIADNFFQGGFGGSFLNHQVLVAGAGTDLRQRRQERGDDGMLDRHRQLRPPLSGRLERLPEHLSALQADGHGERRRTHRGRRRRWTVHTHLFRRHAAAAPAGTLCGDYAVNTIQPFTQPYSPGTAVGRRLPLLTSDNIGDEMSARHVSWAWYAGGWDNAAGNNGRDAMHPLGAGWTNGRWFQPARTRTRRPPRCSRTARTSCSSSTISRSATSRTTRTTRRVASTI